MTCGQSAICSLHFVLSKTKTTENFQWQHTFWKVSLPTLHTTNIVKRDWNGFVIVALICEICKVFCGDFHTEAQTIHRNKIWMAWNLKIVLVEKKVIMKPLRKLFFSSPFSVKEQKLTSNYCKTPNQTPSSCRHIEARLSGIASLHLKLMKSTHLTPPNDYQKYGQVIHGSLHIDSPIY